MKLAKIFTPTICFALAAVTLFMPTATQAASSGAADEIFSTHEFTLQMNEADERLSAFENFASVRLVDQSIVHVHWKGEVPDEALRLVKSIFGDLPVQIDNVRFNRNELNDAKNLAYEKVGALFDRNLVTSVSISSLSDESGIEIQLDAVSPSTVKSAESILGLNQQVPIEVVDTNLASSLSLSRTLNASPFNGGSYFVYPNGEVGNLTCSTGFGVESNVNGEDFLLTAQHCFSGQISAVSIYNYGNQSGGPIATRSSYSPLYNSALDSALMKPSSGVSSNKIFTFGYNSSTTEAISGSANPYLGQPLCTNGGNSGEHCQVIVDDLDQSYTVRGINGRILTFPHLVSASLLPTVVSQGGIAVAQGDSGGPIIQRAYVGGATANYAVGTITAEYNFANCPASLNNSNTTCATSVLFPKISSVLQSLNIQLKP